MAAPGQRRRQGVIRVSVDGVGYVGPVEVVPTTTLANLRKVIASTFDADSIPQFYVFSSNGVAIGSNKETSLLAESFKPSITLLPTDESPIAARVTVALWTGARFTMWALPSCTFQQLRGEASRFWHLNPADTVLCDEDEALWPDSGFLHSALTPADAGAAAGHGAGSMPNAPHVFRPEEQPKFVLRLRDRSLEQLMDPASFASSADDDARPGGLKRGVSVRSRKASRHVRVPDQHPAGGLGLPDMTFTDDFADELVSSPARGASSNGRSGAGLGQDGHGQASADQAGRAGAAATSASGLLIAPLELDTDTDMDVDGRAGKLRRQRSSDKSLSGAGHAGAGSGAGRQVGLPQPLSRNATGDIAWTSGSTANDTSDTPLLMSLRYLHPSIAVDQAGPLAAFAGLEDRLWRIFTWYCTTGDARDPFHLRPRQWKRLLVDCGLLQSYGQADDVSMDDGRVRAGQSGVYSPQGMLPPEHADVIFTSALTEGRRGNGISTGGRGMSTNAGNKRPATSHGSHGDGHGARASDVASVPMAALVLRESAQATDAAVANKHAVATTGLDYVSFLRALVGVAVKLHAVGQATQGQPEQPSAPSASAVEIPPLPSFPVSAGSHAEAVTALTLLLSVPAGSAAPSVTVDVAGAGRGLQLSNGARPNPDTVSVPASLAVGSRASVYGNSHIAIAARAQTIGSRLSAATAARHRQLATEPRLVATGAADALRSLLQHRILPRALCWDAAYWVQESRLMHADGSSTESMLGLETHVGQQQAANGQAAHGTSPGPAGADNDLPLDSILGVLRRFVPALRLLFSYYSEPNDGRPSTADGRPGSASGARDKLGVGEAPDAHEAVQGHAAKKARGAASSDPAGAEKPGAEGYARLHAQDREQRRSASRGRSTGPSDDREQATDEDEDGAGSGAENMDDGGSQPRSSPGDGPTSANGRPRGRSGVASVTSGAANTAMTEYMEKIRQAAAKERAAQYAASSGGAAATDPVSGGATAGAVTGRPSAAPSSRLHMQVAGISPNSVSNINATAAGRRGGTASGKTGTTAAGPTAAVARAGTKAARPSTSAGDKGKAGITSYASRMQQNRAVTAAAVRAVSPLSVSVAGSLDGPAIIDAAKAGSAVAIVDSNNIGSYSGPAAANSSLIDDGASMSFDSFCKFTQECGLSLLGSFGKTPPVPSRTMTEVFLAAACSAPGPQLFKACSSAKGVSGKNGTGHQFGDALAGGLPDPYATRTRLTFPQFLAALARLAVRLGSHTLDVTLPGGLQIAAQLQSGPQRLPASASHAIGLSISAVVIPPALRMKALLHALDNGLSQASKLGPLLSSRRDNLSAKSDRLLRGIAMFHSSYMILLKADHLGHGQVSMTGHGHVDASALLVAHAQQAAATGALEQAQQAVLMAWGLDATGQLLDGAQVSPTSGGGVDGDDHADGDDGRGGTRDDHVYGLKAAWLVEGKALRPEVAAEMRRKALLAGARAGVSPTTGVGAGRDGARGPATRGRSVRGRVDTNLRPRKVVHPPVFAADLVRFAGLSPADAAAVASAYAAAHPPDGTQARPQSAAEGGRPGSAERKPGLERPVHDGEDIDDGGQARSASPAHTVPELDGQVLTAPLAVHVTALADVESVWREQQAARARARSLLSARQADARLLSKLVDDHWDLAAKAERAAAQQDGRTTVSSAAGVGAGMGTGMAQAMGSTGMSGVSSATGSSARTGSGSPTHAGRVYNTATGPIINNSNSRPRDAAQAYEDAIKQVELSRRRAVWAELQAARERTATAVRDAVERQKAARAGALPLPPKPEPVQHVRALSEPAPTHVGHEPTAPWNLHVVMPGQPVGMAPPQPAGMGGIGSGMIGVVTGPSSTASKSPQQLAAYGTSTSPGGAGVPGGRPPSSMSGYAPRSASVASLDKLLHMAPLPHTVGGQPAPVLSRTGSSGALGRHGSAGLGAGIDGGPRRSPNPSPSPPAPASPSSPLEIASSPVGLPLGLGGAVGDDVTMSPTASLTLGPTATGVGLRAMTGGAGAGQIGMGLGAVQLHLPTDLAGTGTAVAQSDGTHITAPGSPPASAMQQGSGVTSGQGSSGKPPLPSGYAAHSGSAADTGRAAGGAVGGGVGTPVASGGAAGASQQAGQTQAQAEAQAQAQASRMPVSPMVTDIAFGALPLDTRGGASFSGTVGTDGSSLGGAAAAVSVSSGISNGSTALRSPPVTGSSTGQSAGMGQGTGPGSYFYAPRPAEPYDHREGSHGQDKSSSGAGSYTGGAGSDVSASALSSAAQTDSEAETALVAQRNNNTTKDKTANGATAQAAGQSTTVSTTAVTAGRGPTVAEQAQLPGTTGQAAGKAERQQTGATERTDTSSSNAAISGNNGAGAGAGPNVGRARSGAIDASARDRPVKPISPPSLSRDTSPEGARVHTQGSMTTVSSAGSPAPAAGAGSAAGRGGPTSGQVQRAASPPAPAPAPAPTDARARDIIDRRLYWKRLLLDGAVFMKFGRSGFPHKRLVWLDTDCEAIRWRKPGSAAGPRDARTEVIVVADMTEVLDGTATPVFSRNIKSISNSDCCFSVVSPARTLDLEASSPAQKEEWITALLALKKYRNLI